MKRLIIIILFIILSKNCFAQEGIQFQTGTWAQMLGKAKAENKLIFVDIYTSWCGPCKAMANDVFPQKPVADFYNSNFICYKIDAEKGEGPTLAKKYEIEGYPTYIYVDNTGDLIYKSMGSMPADKFINEGESAILTLKAGTVADMENNYEAQKTDTTFLLTFIDRLKTKAQDFSKPFNQYITLKEHPVSSKIFFLMEQCTDYIPLQSPLFNFYLQNFEKFSSLTKEINALNPEVLRNILAVNAGNSANTKNEKLFQQVIDLDTKYLNAEDVFGFSYDYYSKTEDIDKFFSLVDKKYDQDLNLGVKGLKDEASKYAQMLSESYAKSLEGDPKKDEIIKEKQAEIVNSYLIIKARDLNDAASVTLKLSKTPIMVKKTLQWSALGSAVFPNNLNHLETYATSLYRNGQKKTAQAKLKAAITSQANNTDKAQLAKLKAQYRKMQAGKF